MFCREIAKGFLIVLTRCFKQDDSRIAFLDKIETVLGTAVLCVLTPDGHLGTGKHLCGFQINVRYHH